MRESSSRGHRPAARRPPGVPGAGWTAPAHPAPGGPRVPQSASRYPMPRTVTIRPAPTLRRSARTNTSTTFDPGS